MSAERYIRMCPAHALELKGLDCPKGHHVTQWDVVDRQTSRALSRSDIEEGEMVMTNANVRENKVAGKRTIQKQLFVDRFKTKLIVRLIQRPIPKFGGDPFLVAWDTEAPETKTRERGTLSTHPDNAAALQAFNASVLKATQGGWTKSAFTPTGRASVIKPLPAANVKPSRA